MKTKMPKTSKFSRFFKRFWLHSDDPFNKDWDDLLNLLIDVGKVTDIDEHTITFNDKYEVWIANHPYASGGPWSIDNKSVPLVSCSKDTRIRLEDFVNFYTYDDPDEEFFREYIQLFKTEIE